MSAPGGPGEDSKHSVFTSASRAIGGFPILQIRDTVNKKTTTPAFDIVDEAIYHFRTNIFMQDFPITSDADRLLIYLTFFGMKCLKLIAKNPKDKAKCAKEIQAWQMNPFPIPGEGGFILEALVTSAPTPPEKAELKGLFSSLRYEMGFRLLEKVFKGAEADKWWVCFAARKFMDKEMPN